MPKNYEEEEPRREGRIIGYCNNGALYSRPAVSRHRAISNSGELGERIMQPKEVKPKKTKEA